MAASKLFTQAVELHRARLEGLLTRKAARQMKNVFDAATEKTIAKLAATVRAKKRDTFTAYQQRTVLAQLKQAQALTAKRMAGELGPLSKEAQATALQGLIDDVADLSKKFAGKELVLPIDEAARFQGVIDERASSMAKQHAKSMARYGANVVQKVENKLALSLLTGESSSEAVDGIAETIEGEWWQGERIVRTEMSFAFNSAHHDGIVDAAADIPELMMRWEEQCDDAGNPFDNRVAVDSIAMHAQVATPGKLFYMPDTSEIPDAKGRTEVPAHLAGEAWPFPPNRPQDRAVLSPWMEDWGIPGWKYEDGDRIWYNR